MTFNPDTDANYALVKAGEAGFYSGADADRNWLLTFAQWFCNAATQTGVTLNTAAITNAVAAANYTVKTAQGTARNF